jgi:hypothetical protein
MPSATDIPGGLKSTIYPSTANATEAVSDSASMTPVPNRIVLLNIASLLLKVLLDYHVAGDASIFRARSQDSLPNNQSTLRPNCARGAPREPGIKRCEQPP